MKKSAFAIIFSDISGKYIKNLTEQRTMASVPFGGRYRMVDFILSSLVNSNIMNIGVITKQNYFSLMDHLGSGADWDLARKNDGLMILPPMSISGASIYNNKIEALANVINHIKYSDSDNIILTNCNEVINIDFSDLISFHESRDSDITVVYKSLEISLSPDIDPDSAVVMELDEEKVKKIKIKPGSKGMQNMSLDIMVFKRDLLVELITSAISDSKQSFERDILQAAVTKYNVCGYKFEGFSKRIEDMESFFGANMSLLSKEATDELFNKERPVYTKVGDDFPATYGLESKVSNAVVGDGSLIEGEVVNSIIFRGVKVAAGAKVKNSILMQNTTVEKGATLEYVVTDKNVVITVDKALKGDATYPLFIEKGKII